MPACSTPDVPVLGICYGMQLMTDALGGQVAPAPQREFGHATITDRDRTRRSSRSCPPSCACGRATATSSRPRRAGFAVTATSANAPVAAMADAGRAASTRCCSIPKSRTPITALEILRNFAVRRLRLHRRLDDGVVRARRATARIRAQVGDGRVVCGLTGGVDSTVAALLIHRAIGDRLTCIFVDNGVLRQDEAAQIRKRFERLQLPLVFVDASRLFLERLAGVTDPEQKRKIIGATFIDVFEARSREARHVRLPGAGHALSGRDRERVGRSGRRT